MATKLENFNRLLKIVPKSDPREALKGVLIESQSTGDATRFVATDGSRLGLLNFYSIFSEPTDIPALTYIIPLESAKALFALSKKDGFTMRFEACGAIDVSTLDGDHLLLDLRKVEYPDYNAVIPADKPDDLHLRINRDFLAQCGSFAEISIPKTYYVSEEGFLLCPTKIRTTNGMYVIMPIRGSDDDGIAVISEEAPSDESAATDCATTESNNEEA